jgi:carbamate kinase
MARNRRSVVAIGGNALSDPREMAGAEEQGRKIEQVAIHLVGQMQQGISLLVVHGNGAQVGARLLQNEAARGSSAVALPVCTARRRDVGHQFVLALSSELHRRGPRRCRRLVKYALSIRSTGIGRATSRSAGLLRRDGEAPRGTG